MGRIYPSRGDILLTSSVVGLTGAASAMAISVGRGIRGVGPSELDPSAVAGYP
jgi:hypothetical protein